MSKIDWKIRTLDEVCNELFAGGDVPKQNHSKVLTEEYQIPIFSNGEKDKGLYGYTNTARVTKPCLTISARGTIGYTEIRKESFYPAVRLIVAVPNEDLVNLYYLKYVISSFDFVHSGSSIPQLTIPMIRSHKINLPPLSVQTKIVKILDKKFEAIEELMKLTEQQIFDAKELFGSRLSEVFESPKNKWSEVFFSDVCDITSKLIDPKEQEYQDLVHIGAGNIVAVTGELENLKTAREEKLISGKFLFDANMVLYSKIRPYLMKVVRPNFSGLCSADIYPLMPKNEVLTKDFLFYVLLSKKFTDYAIKGSARAGMPKVNREHLFAYSFFLPSINEQLVITKELDELSEKTKELEAIFRKKIADLEELKKSYLEQAFSGNL